MVVLATLATVIASQAVISGAFSVTRQAVQLGFLPRLTIRHTSEHEVGQVYVPARQLGPVRRRGRARRRLRLLDQRSPPPTGSRSPARWRSTRSCSSSSSGSLWQQAAVAGDRRRGRLPGRRPVVLRREPDQDLPRRLVPAADRAACVFTVLTTWQRGRELVTAQPHRGGGPAARLRRARSTTMRAAGLPVPGTAVFLNANQETTPLALRANVEHNHVAARERRDRLDRDAEGPARATPTSALTVDDLGYQRRRHHALTAQLRLPGRAERPDARCALASRQGLECDSTSTNASYFLSRITIVRTEHPGCGAGARSCSSSSPRRPPNPVEYFGLPDDRTIVMGSQVEV